MAIGELARRSLARAGAPGLVDGVPTAGLVARTMAENEDALVEVTQWSIPGGIGKVGLPVELEGKSYTMSALVEVGELGETWVLQDA